MNNAEIQNIRRDFPGLHQKVYGKNVVYLDNAATSQKPQAVIDSQIKYYSEYCGNVHRGVHRFSQLATERYENTREQLRCLINAETKEEIIFTHGGTEAINLVAQSYGRQNLHKGDEILISEMEHHSNLVPWQMVAEVTGAVIKKIPMDEQGNLLLDIYSTLLSERTKIVAVTHASNALGTINDIKHVTQKAHAVGAVVVVDGAQAASHLRIDVQDLDADFYMLSAHKMFAPTGVGVLYGKQKLLEEMPPYQGGGDMIASVTFEKTTYAQLPLKFEAGTTNIAGIIGLGAVLDYLNAQDTSSLHQYEGELLRYAEKQLSLIEGLTIWGKAQQKVSLISFTLAKVHPHDVSSILDRQGIAVRGGHLCAQPVMKRLGLNALVRASFSFYNTFSEVDALVAGIRKVNEVMRVG